MVAVTSYDACGGPGNAAPFKSSSRKWKVHFGVFFIFQESVTEYVNVQRPVDDLAAGAEFIPGLFISPLL